ncbi:MAG: GerMN domain-containing protein [Eubacterium sp.]|nr:GerMN domain-containing protein [Eubacterium sp.]
MKNGKKFAIAAAAAVALLMACGKKADETIVSGEMAVPEMSSEDLLVSSLEYLLEEDGQEDSQDQRQSSESDDFVNQADNVNSDAPTESGDAVDVDGQQPPDAEQGETAVIYYGSGGSSELKEEMITIPEKTPEELIGALARHNIVSLDTNVLSFEETKEGERTVLYLDLSKAAGEYLRTMSKEAECIIIASIASTFVENYDADAVYLMVEGETLVTSNAEYAEAVGRCTPAELMQKSGEVDDDTVQKTGNEDAVQETGAEDSGQDEEKGLDEQTQSKLPLVQEKE